MSGIFDAVAFLLLENLFSTCCDFIKSPNPAPCTQYALLPSTPANYLPTGSISCSPLTLSLRPLPVTLQPE